MKKCPFCAEEIQDAAVKCRHCGEFLIRTQTETASEPHPRQCASAASAEPSMVPSEPWYFRTTFLVIAFCVVGPLMLPLLWLHPRHSLTAKFFWTLFIAALTWVLMLVLAQSIRTVWDYYGQLFDLLRETQR